MKSPHSPMLLMEGSLYTRKRTLSLYVMNSSILTSAVSVTVSVSEGFSQFPSGTSGVSGFSVTVVSEPVSEVSEVAVRFSVSVVKVLHPLRSVESDKTTAMDRGSSFLFFILNSPYF